MEKNNYFNSFKKYIDEYIESEFCYIRDLDIIKQNSYVVFDYYYNKYSDVTYLDSLKQVFQKHFYFQVLAYTLNNIDLLDFEDRVVLSKRIVSKMKSSCIRVNVENLMNSYCLSERVAADIINYSTDEYKQDIYKSKKEISYDTFEDDVIDNIEKKVLFKNSLQKHFM